MSFTHPLENYTRDFEVTDNYVRQLAIGLARLRDCSVEIATEFMLGILNENKSRIEGTKIEFTVRQENGDRVVKEVPILDYIKRINDVKLGMSPTMTSYKRPDQELSLIVEDIAGSMDKRKIVKREGQIAKQQGDSVLTTIKNGGQNAIKVLINSWSGATLDKHNPFNCQSTHPTLTTMCRISTALATASVEKFLAGKRYYHKPEKVIEDILVILDKVDKAAVAMTMTKYKLKFPSVKDCLDVIKRSTNYYWWDSDGMVLIEELVNKLSAAERAAFVYDGDFYHIYIHNKEFIDEMLTNLSDSLVTKDPGRERFKEMDEDISNLVSNLMGTEIKGNALWDYLDEEKHPADNPVKAKANRIASNLLDGLDKYKLLVSTFFRVNHFPIDVGAQNHAIRITVPLGDTDSTIFSTKHINALYYGEAKFDEEQEPVSDVMVYMVNGIIAHALGNFTAQLGVVPERRKLLVMKNEYKFPSLQLTPVAKTYHAYVKAQEGLVFDSPDFELKGARNHAGATNADIVAELHEYMNNNLTNLNKGIKINRGELIDIVLRIENDIEASLHRREDIYYKRVRVKTEAEYKTPNSSEWAQYTLWQALFAEEYDKAPDPVYMTYAIPIDFGGKLQNLLDALTDKQVRAFRVWQAKHEKKPDAFPSFVAVPITNFLKHGVPKVLLPFVDRRKIINFVTDAHRLNLASMGIVLDYSDGLRTMRDIIEED